MSSGKKQKAAVAQPANASVNVPPPVNLSGYTPQGVGPNVTPQTFTAEGKPKWMTGVWDMPTWGMSASNPSQPIAQNQLQAQAPPPPPPPVQQQQQPTGGPQSMLDKWAAEQEAIRKRLEEAARSSYSSGSYSPG